MTQANKVYLFRGSISQGSTLYAWGMGCALAQPA